MIDLILLTAVMNYENILTLQPIIEEKQKKFPQINLLWVICRDAFNGRGDIGRVTESLFKSKIQWVMYDSGKEGQKNYGGDMYNAPLFDILERRYKGSDPWVYILDDDNILCDRMFYALENVYNNSKKRIIWMHYLMSCGSMCKVIPSESFDMNLYNGTLFYKYNPDPSALLFRGSIYKECGGFLGREDYDFTSCRNMCMYHYDEILYDNFYDTRYTTFHNGMRSKTQIDEVEKCINTKDTSSALFIQINDDNNDTFFNLGSTANKHIGKSIVIPILKANTIKKIIAIIKEEYEEQYGTKDTDN